MEEKLLESLPDIITLKEHGILNEYSEVIKNLNIGFCKTAYNSPPKYLGIHPQTLQASYYIGAAWLTYKCAVVITPKMSNLDFVEMFVCALKFEPAAEYFSKFYSIDFEEKPIKTNVFNNQITPLIIIHFIAILKKLTKRGLKKAYVIKEENLQSKIKGKIKIVQHIKQNIFSKREDRVYCQYQEYTVNNIENRILKKALLYAESYIIGNLSKHDSFTKLIATINNIKNSFTGVSEDIELFELKSVINNKIFKEYSEGIRIAKMILQKFNYSILETKTTSNFTPVFWIDMSRLYEVYVYSKLYNKYGDKIKFQVPGYRTTAVDFIETEQKIIIDTKYKPQYSDSNKGIIEDVRQISAYARDKKIREAMGCKEDCLLDCLIICPEKMIDDEDNEIKDNLPDDCKELNSFDGVDNLCGAATEIRGYKRFYKLSFPMPKNNDREASI